MRAPLETQRSRDGFPEGFRVQRIGVTVAMAISDLPSSEIARYLCEHPETAAALLSESYDKRVTGSGRKVRPQFERMLLAASQRKFDLLLFWVLDRLSREGIVRTLGYLEQLRAWNIGWRSYTQPFLDTGNEMTNGIVLSVLSAVAQQERITLSERTKAGLQRAKRKLGRRAVDVDIAKVDRLRAEGFGLRVIAVRVGVSVNTLQKARRKG